MASSDHFGHELRGQSMAANEQGARHILITAFAERRFSGPR
jgi:hypothetical protein